MHANFLKTKVQNEYIMNKKRSIFGIGIYWAIVSIIYSIIVVFVNIVFFERLIIRDVPMLLLDTFGIGLLAFGLIMMIVSIITFRIAFKNNKLITKGIYSIVRHPLYSSIILLIVPGIVILTKLILGLTVPVFMLIAYKFMIYKEEHELFLEFGNDYIVYRNQTNALIPKLN